MSNSPIALRIYELSNNQTYYAAVESTFINPGDGYGAKDAISIYMGTLGVNRIDAMVSCSTEEAKKFAEEIISICNEIEKGIE